MLTDLMSDTVGVGGMDKNPPVTGYDHIGIYCDTLKVCETAWMN